MVSYGTFEYSRQPHPNLSSVSVKSISAVTISILSSWHLVSHYTHGHHNNALRVVILIDNFANRYPRVHSGDALWVLSLVPRLAVLYFLLY